MHAQLYRPAEPDTVVALAVWDGRDARLELGEGAPAGLEEILRATPVVVEDPSLRRQGTHGESLLQPGSLEWFRAALVSRSEAFGLAVRFVPTSSEGGWDPASQYRTFGEQVARLASEP